ncbi:MAG: hypothetical protein PHU27_05580 [Salinivirgaceae bacterium]|nr:hypothetical protein [Salinivirgaceae bacterium]MDD4748184.1 hypothetical protein [Salinivirgaceae bacterium]MDY0282200.1 hypothetical protein [Salinivirgaceae bacterium]
MKKRYLVIATLLLLAVSSLFVGCKKKGNDTPERLNKVVYGDETIRLESNIYYYYGQVEDVFLHKIFLLSDDITVTVSGSNFDISGSGTALFLELRSDTPSIFGSYNIGTNPRVTAQLFRNWPSEKGDEGDDNLPQFNKGSITITGQDANMKVEVNFNSTTGVELKGGFEGTFYFANY